MSDFIDGVKEKMSGPPLAVLLTEEDFETAEELEALVDEFPPETVVIIPPLRADRFSLSDGHPAEGAENGDR